MYMVVSKWEANPGQEAQFEAIGRKMREMLRHEPGTTTIEAIRSGNEFTVVHVYASEADYNRTVNDPQGVFAKGLQETNLENVGHWISSVKGETLE